MYNLCMNRASLDLESLGCVLRTSTTPEALITWKKNKIINLCSNTSAWTDLKILFWSLLFSLFLFTMLFNQVNLFCLFFFQLSIYSLITQLIVISIAPLTEYFVIARSLICNCSLLKDFSFNTKCLLVWCD